jgi:hypothetical protein
MDLIYFVRLQSGTKRREMAVNELAVFVGDQFLFLWFGSVRCRHLCTNVTLRSLPRTKPDYFGTSNANRMQNKLREVCFCGIRPVVVYPSN